MGLPTDRLSSLLSPPGGQRPRPASPRRMGGVTPLTSPSLWEIQASSIQPSLGPTHRRVSVGSPPIPAQNPQWFLVTSGPLENPGKAVDNTLSSTKKSGKCEQSLVVDRGRFLAIPLCIYPPSPQRGPLWHPYHPTVPHHQGFLLLSRHAVFRPGHQANESPRDPTQVKFGANGLSGSRHSRHGMT